MFDMSALSIAHIPHCDLFRVCGAQSSGPGAHVGVLLAGGANDRPDVEVGQPPGETHFLS